MNKPCENLYATINIKIKSFIYNIQNHQHPQQAACRSQRIAAALREWHRRACAARLGGAGAPRALLRLSFRRAGAAHRGSGQISLGLARHSVRGAWDDGLGGALRRSLAWLALHPLQREREDGRTGLRAHEPVPQRAASSVHVLNSCATQLA